MSDKYKMPEKGNAYFLTLIVVDWVDVFIQEKYKQIVIDSLKYCQQQKGLEIYAWCLMTNHLHLMAKATGEQSLPEVIRDFKKFTAKAICKEMMDSPGSRSKWMLTRFEYRGKYLNRITNFKFWQDGNQARIIYSPDIFYQKLAYIHKNPVKARIVTRPEDYVFSSARNYAGLSALLDIVIETQRLITVK
jgi:REP element-mobilizing transposase RayT